METGGNLLLFVEVFVVDLQVVAVPPAPTSPHWDLDTLLRLYKNTTLLFSLLPFLLLDERWKNL